MKSISQTMGAANEPPRGFCDTKLVIFDLDGTLVDSATDIALSVNELLEGLGRTPLPLEEVYRYIGDGVGKLLERSLDTSEDDELRLARERYLRIYRRRLLQHTRVYPGVVDALEGLYRDRSLAVLTNKPQRESRALLRGLGLSSYFAAIYGGDSFSRRKPDPMGVYHLLDELGAGPHQSLFVGDSRVDFETARNASVRCCLVSYGIRPEDTLELDPDLRVDDLRELIPLVHG